MGEHFIDMVVRIHGNGDGLRTASLLRTFFTSEDPNLAFAVQYIVPIISTALHTKAIFATMHAANENTQHRHQRLHTHKPIQYLCTTTSFLLTIHHLVTAFESVSLNEAKDWHVAEKIDSRVIMLLRIPDETYLVGESLLQSLGARARRGSVTGEATPADLAACSSLTANSPM